VNLFIQDIMLSIDCAAPNVDSSTIGLGTFLIIGTFLSFLPQYIEIVHSKSSKGISWIWQFVGNINQFTQFMNDFILQFNSIWCCKKLGFLTCSPGLLPFYQLFVQWIAFFPIYIFYLVYFDKEEGGPTKTRELKNATIFFYLLIFITIFCSCLASIFIVTVGSNSVILTTYAYILGIISASMTVIQWAPQIYMTLKTKRKGSLSILMLIGTAPGSLILAFFFYNKW